MAPADGVDAAAPEAIEVDPPPARVLTAGAMSTSSWDGPVSNGTTTLTFTLSTTAP